MNHFMSADSPHSTKNPNFDKAWPSKDERTQYFYTSEASYFFTHFA